MHAGCVLPGMASTTVHARVLLVIFLHGARYYLVVQRCHQRLCRLLARLHTHVTSSSSKLLPGGASWYIRLASFPSTNRTQ
jgi:hypothetical protein